MSLISADSLFHFTGTLGNLVGILQSGFRPRLSLERFDYITQYFPNSEHLRESGIPMVCFCDIPLSQVNTHMEHYGCYGIGLSKQWGLSHRVTPVAYTHDKSPLPESIASLLALLSHLEASQVPPFMKGLALESGKMVYYLKPYEGTLERPDNTIHNVRFYNEREWRYVPRTVEDIPAISRDDLADPVRSAPTRTQVDALASLLFGVEDIHYLIVSSEEDVLSLVHALESASNYSRDAKDLLKTRIVSAERIRTDF